MRSNDMSSIGGFLPLHINNLNNEYYTENTISLNAARNAILLAMRDGGFRKILIPIYTCESIRNTLERDGYSIEYYNIGNDFSPVLDTKQIEEINRRITAILITNYFGVYYPSRGQRSISFRSQIIDNTQCFFEPPQLDSYNVYSCRKFFGVSDGAYLVYRGLKEYVFKQDYSSARAAYLLSSFEKGTNEVYNDYLLAEKDIDNSPIMRMSLLTKSIMCSIDYEDINKRRMANFSVLDKAFRSINELTFEIPEMSPMVYPLLISDDSLRQELLKNCIYIPQWWKWVLESDLSNSFERRLCKYLLPLPIDQRYGSSDMERIINVISKAL